VRCLGNAASIEPLPAGLQRRARSPIMDGSPTSVLRMSAPLVITIPHRLGKQEALRRLQQGLGNAGSSFSHLFSIQEQTWTGDHLQFRVSALGQSANGTIDVADDSVRLEVFLPWLLAKLAETLQPLIRKEGTLLLEKK
jgi:hypothetical protein